MHTNPRFLALSLVALTGCVGPTRRTLPPEPTPTEPVGADDAPTVPSPPIASTEACAPAGDQVAWGWLDGDLVTMDGEGDLRLLAESEAPGFPAALNLQVKQGGDSLLVVGTWWTPDEVGTVLRLFEGGELRWEAVRPGESGTAWLGDDGSVAFDRGWDGGPVGVALYERDGSVVEWDGDRVAAGRRIGALPVCRDDECGWVLDDPEAPLWNPLPSTATFHEAGPYVMRYLADPEEPMLTWESPWYPVFTDLGAVLSGESAEYATLQSVGERGHGVVGWQDADGGDHWVVVGAQAPFELDVAERGGEVEAGWCMGLPPTFVGDDLLYATRDDEAATFVVRDAETGIEEPIGAPVTDVLFAQGQERDGTWLLATGDGSDTFCGGPERPFAGTPGMLAGNTLQVLRPQDDVAVAVPSRGTNPWNPSTFIAPGGRCVALIAGTEFDAGWATLDASTGELAELPVGFAFGGWMEPAAR